MGASAEEMYSYRESMKQIKLHLKKNVLYFF